MNFVGFYFHPAAASEALLSPPQLPVQIFDGNRDAGWESGKGGHKALAMGFSSSFEAQHWMIEGDNFMVTDMLDWREARSELLHMGAAFLLTAVIGWNREQEERSLGIRSFPIVGVASCAYLLLMASQQKSDPASFSRVLQGLITGIGFVGGGAIVKEGMTTYGTATAASVWCAGAIGAAIAMDHYSIAVLLTLMNLLALRGLMPLKNMLDRRHRPPAA